MHPKVEHAIQEIDAALFNGDTFDKPKARKEISYYVMRWANHLDVATTDHLLALAALRAMCDCNENPPANWNEGHARIPHHCDCPLYTIELPDEKESPSAYADAIKRRKELLDAEA